MLTIEKKPIEEPVKKVIKPVTPSETNEKKPIEKPPKLIMSSTYIMNYMKPMSWVIYVW